MDYETQIGSLNHFLISWDLKYKFKLEKIMLFKPNWTHSWSYAQKVTFIKLFYHIRRHFYEFVWYIGSYTEDRETKEFVLRNIEKEFNGSGLLSYEKMYYVFAEQFKINIHDELLNKKHYLDFIKEFSVSHIVWLTQMTPEEMFIAFSTYERINVIDYKELLKLAISIGTEEESLDFFKSQVSSQNLNLITEKQLNILWKEHDKQLIKIFNYMASHQLDMWQKISNYLELL